MLAAAAIHAAAGVPAGPVNWSRKTPVLLNTIASGITRGHNTGGAVATHPAGLVLVLDSLAANTLPTALGGGWTSRAAWANASGDDDTSARLSTKVVAANEGIPACTGGSRRGLVILGDYATDRDPVVSLVTAEGTGNNASWPAGLGFEVNADGSTLVPGLVVALGKRTGSGTFAWAAPAGTEGHNQNTTAVAGFALGAAAVTSWPGMSLAVGVGNDWLTAAVLIAGEKL